MQGGVPKNVDHSGKNVIRNARKLGISSTVENTPSLALGTFEVTVLDMATAYTAIANGGFAVWPHAVDEIYSRDGYQLYQREKNDKLRVLDAKTVKGITDMLVKVVKEGTGDRAKIDGFAAGKTGTSQNNRDAWFVGFTKNLVAVVWLGNDDNSPMSGVHGSGLPAQIWKQLMD